MCSPVGRHGVHVPNIAEGEQAAGDVLPEEFYALPTVEVARNLLAKELLHETEEGLAGGIIVETEAYVLDDPASHAYGGVTPRNRVMFGKPGHAYVYLSYGCHWLLNVVTEPAGVGAAVLVRALQPTRGSALMARRRRVRGACVPVGALTSGPGRVAQALGVVPQLNGACLRSGPITVRTAPPGAMALPYAVTVTPRVGISRGVDLPLRFHVAGNPFVSGGSNNGRRGRR
jgi:DNA-3-methyladenine glycosylase